MHSPPVLPEPPKTAEAFDNRSQKKVEYRATSRKSGLRKMFGVQVFRRVLTSDVGASGDRSYGAHAAGGRLRTAAANADNRGMRNGNACRDGRHLGGCSFLHSAVMITSRSSLRVRFSVPRQSGNLT